MRQKDYFGLWFQRLRSKVAWSYSLSLIVRSTSCWEALVEDAVHFRVAEKQRKRRGWGPIPNCKGVSSRAYVSPTRSKVLKILLLSDSANGWWPSLLPHGLQNPDYSNMVVLFLIFKRTFILANYYISISSLPGLPFLHTLVTHMIFYSFNRCEIIVWLWF